MGLQARIPSFQSSPAIEKFIKMIFQLGEERVFLVSIIVALLIWWTEL